MSSLPQRKNLHHSVPSWVKSGSKFFVTINCAKRGFNQLCRDPVSNSLLQSVEFYHQKCRWHCSIFLLMPDHAHAIISLPPNESMPSVVKSWKRYTAKYCPISWQSGFFDHRIRDDESWEEKAQYIRLNPVRRGLIEKIDDWPYRWPKA
ncbi:MAG TPA: hypothetical protein DIV79_08625 [Opitutae bacterium]|nr:hypothetical protein [Opitutae bacterium]